MERRGQTVAGHHSGAIVRVLRGQISRQIAVAIAVLLALLLRVALAEQSITLPTYVTFYPVVFLAAVLGGMWAGILATTLSALMADYFLLEPVGQFAIHSTSDIVGMVIFCFSGVFVSVVTEYFRRSRENLATATLKAAILNERSKVEEAEELDKTVHAERLRFLDVLVSLRATDISTILSESGQGGRILSAAGDKSWFPGLDQREFRAFLRRTVTVPFIAAMVLAGASLWAAYDLYASMQEVDRSDQVIGQSRRLLKLLVDMETGERGYLVTGNDAFLQPYQEATKVVDSEYQKLYLLVDDNPPQQDRLETLHNGIHHWQGYAEQMIALRRAGGEYADLKTNLAGKGEVDQIRDQIAGFQNVEEHLRDERIRVAHRDWRLVEAICILFSLGIGSGLIVFVFRRMEIIAASFEKSGRALAESERRWATTLSSIGDGVLAADTQGRVTFLNPAAVALTGWQPEEAQGQPVQIVFKTINEETRAPAKDIVDQVLKEERVVELANHTALLARDGREIPIADSAAPILDSEGIIAGVVLVFHDVTERRRAENVLRITLQRFYSILSNLNSAVLLVSDKGQTEFANQVFCDVFGFVGAPADQMGVDSAAMIERIKSCYIHPDQETRRIREIVDQGEPIVNEEIPMRNGRVFLRDYVPLIVDGKTYGRMWVHTDITEFKRKEEALNEFEAKMAAAMASMTDSVIITDAEGRFVEFNDAYAKFYRFKNKAECAMNFDEFASLFEVFMANGERAPLEMYAIRRALRGETGSNVEYRVRRKDTGESWIGSISFNPIRDKDGAIIGSVITARDITEAKQAEEERLIATDFLGMVNQSQGTKDLLQRAANFFQERSGCEAVGIRLREGEDYPYIEARGFSTEFVQLESKLCVRTASGKAVRDSAGKPVLECLCGNVIRGQFESSKPFYTAHGSFWSNSTTDLVAGATEGDLPSSARHRCNRAGYESVALFPIYVGEERFGLVQLNDRRKGRFSAQSIVLWERLAGHLATAVAKFQAEDALQESEKRYRNLFNSMNEGFCIVEVLFDAGGKAQDYLFLEANDAFEKQTGLLDAVGKRMRELAPNHEEYWFEIYGRIALTGKPEHFMNEARALNRWYDVHAYRVGEPEMRRVAIVFNDFSDYKRAEDALRESEEQLRLALDAGNMATWDMDIASGSANWNEEMFLLLGYEPDSIPASYEAWKQRVLPEDLSMAETALRQSLEYGGGLRSEYRVLSGDDKVCWVEARGRCERDSNGNAIRSFGVMMDVTERKQAEEQLRKLNQTLTALSNSNQAFLHVTDERSFLDEVCRIIIRDCGHAMVWIGVAEQDETKTVRPIAHSGFDEGYLEKLRVRWDESEYGRGPTGTAIRTGEPSICRDMRTCAEFAPWRADAILRGYASSLVIPLKERDQVWGAITIYSRELDSFSEAEVDLLKELARDVESGVQMLRLRAAQARAEEALVESKEQLGLFIEYAPAALAMFDDKMRYMYASRRWKSDYGLRDREIRGLSYYEMFPEIPEQWKEAHRRGLAGEVQNGEADRFERSDGVVQWVRWEVRPWHDAEGNVGGIVIFSEEVSERKKAEEALLRSEKEAFRRQQLQALAERLRQVREEERKMVARDLHDQIGQILTAIKLDVSWVVRHLPKSEDAVHSRLTRSIEFINDGVRSVRRICSGLRPGILDDLGLAPAIEWQANEFSTRTGIPCQVSIPSGELHMDGDRATAIFRIFQECLTNVARHAEAQSVRASLSKLDENLILTVADDGKGFLESEVSDSLGVLGMKERAQVCGGSVQVSSSPGKGTTIIVRVPAQAANTERDEDAYSDSR
jgi:PAS domain S-box-containing protein